MANSNTSFDSPWKEVVEIYLPEFIAFFFPEAYDAINWDRGFEFLDQELQQVARDAELGKRFVDKLVKVYLNDGQETWILLHIEIQSQYEQNFAERIYVYNYRIYDKYRRNVVSLVVLGDESENWRPTEFGSKLFGCEIQFTFPSVKLLDFAQVSESLADDVNPFAVVVLAHLTANETRKNQQARFKGKLSLTRRLYRQGLSRQDILNLYRFIDWVIGLPEQLEQDFLEEVRQFEEENRMPYITNAERLGIKQGMQQGMQQGLQQGMQQGMQQGLQQGMQREGANLVLRQLNRRFGSVAGDIEPQIRQLSVEQLEDLGEALLDFATEQDLLNWLNLG